MRIRRMLAAILLGGGVVSPAAADGRPPPTDQAAVLPEPTLVENSGLKPPPPLTSPDGTRLAGDWYGPYTFRNFHSGKCLDVLGASLQNGAPIVQYTCVANGMSQMWWFWTAINDAFVQLVHMQNHYSGKCLDVYGFDRGAGLIQDPCVGTDRQIWMRTSNAQTIYTNYRTGFRMEVQGASKANFARIVQWTDHGQAHQHWLRYDGY
jgi:hypothetical protein